MDGAEDYEKLDQGFWRNLVSKLGSAELSHSQYIFNVNDYRLCSFTDDEDELLIITRNGQYYKLPIENGRHVVM